MSDFTGVGDWDLQAVVRGCTNGFFTTIMDDPPTCFSPLTRQQDDFVLSVFPDLFETTTVSNELEELYKPFYPILNPLSPQTISAISGGEREPEKVQDKEPLAGPPAVAAAATTAPGVKYKRRKNQHKRVVLQLTAEGLSSDVWAWRKYGQKPIKGSPFPRSYYRCSTLKGCLARKQVERNPSDPEMFVITYTAEHCHSQPTRKNSLAGTTRHRFSTPKSSTAGDPDTPPAKDSSSSSPVSSAVLSPPTPSSATIEDESSQQGIQKERTEEEKEEDKHHFIGDMMSSDDFLMGFDELDRLMTSDLAYNGDFCSVP